MQVEFGTTPFGGRRISLARLTAQRLTLEVQEGRAVDKWQLYKDVCEARTVLGTNDRALAVLSALLSFYPVSELSEENGLVVFPSNKQLSLRAHGMPDTSLRRNLAALINAGLIQRRDSPNGKRYAYKNRAGEVEEAFGFSLAPLLARADEIAQAAEQVRAEALHLKRTRGRITLQRRDISQLIEVAIEEGAAGDWDGLWRRFRSIVDSIPRRATLTELETILEELTSIRLEVDNALNSLINDQKMDGNDSQNGRQQSNSDTDSLFEYETTIEKRKSKIEPRENPIEPRENPIEPRENPIEPRENPIEPMKSYPLALILKACPEIINYAVDGVTNWRHLMAATAQVRGYLGISPSAYADALDVLGQENTAIVIACILERAHHINSAGGYLRALTEKARKEEFTVLPMVMALLNSNGFEARMTG